MTDNPNRRVLLKLSGEAFADPAIGYGIEPLTVHRVADEIAEAAGSGVEVAVVVGGGNIFRGVSQAAKGMDPATADYMGMLATVMNALALRDALESADVVTRVQSAITMQELAEIGTGARTPEGVRSQRVRRTERAKADERQSKQAGREAEAAGKLEEGLKETAEEVGAAGDAARVAASALPKSNLP